MQFGEAEFICLHSPSAFQKSLFLLQLLLCTKSNFLTTSTMMSHLMRVGLHLNVRILAGSLQNWLISFKFQEVSRHSGVLS